MAKRKPTIRGTRIASCLDLPNPCCDQTLDHNRRDRLLRSEADRSLRQAEVFECMRILFDNFARAPVKRAVRFGRAYRHQHLAVQLERRNAAAHRFN